MVLKRESVTLILSQNYDSNSSRQRLNSFETLTIMSIVWSSAPLKLARGVAWQYSMRRPSREKINIVDSA